MTKKAKTLKNGLMIQNAVLNITQALGVKQDFTSCVAILGFKESQIKYKGEK